MQSVDVTDYRMVGIGSPKSAARLVGGTYHHWGHRVRLVLACIAFDLTGAGAPPPEEGPLTHLANHAQQHPGATRVPGRPAHRSISHAPPDQDQLAREQSTPDPGRWLEARVTLWWATPEG